MISPILFLSVLSAVATASPTHFNRRSTQDDYPTDIGHPAYCKKLGICEYSKTPEANDTCEAGYTQERRAGTTECTRQCTDTEKKTCQYYSCNVAWAQCEDDDSFESCSNALNTCEPVGGRPMSEAECEELFVGYDGSVCKGCTLYGNGRCHINPEAYKQFSEGDRCVQSTETCKSGGDCVSALLDCEYVGGPEISERKCENAVTGYMEGKGQQSDKKVTCNYCVSYNNGRCLLDELRFSRFQERHQLV